MRKFAQVGPFCDLYETDVDINTINSFDFDSVPLADSSKKLGGQKYRKFELLCFSSDLVEILHGR